MPRYLKQDAIRRLEASIHALHLAIMGLATARLHKVRESSSTYAAEIGLIGASAELAMSAVVVQIYSPGYLITSNGRLKNSKEILDDFLKLLRRPPAQLSVLSKGVDNPEEFAREILNLAQSFRILFKVRAGGFHAGRAPTRDVCLAKAADVARFLKLLGRPDRVRPYLSQIPEPPVEGTNRVALVEELTRKVSGASDSEEKGELLSSLFLVLPDIPEDKPDWIDAFERITLAPKERDIAYLLRVLDGASLANLYKVAGDGKVISVNVGSKDDDLPSFKPHFLKTEFSKIPDQWQASSAVSNGRLITGFLDLPDSELVYEVFALGIDNLGLLPEGDSFTAHRAWPFIASSLAIQGTPGPYWFILRRSRDLGQVAKLLTHAIEIGSGYLVGRKKEVLSGLKALRKNKPLEASSELSITMKKELERRQKSREELMHAYKRHEGKLRGLDSESAEMINSIVRNKKPVDELLMALVEQKADLHEKALPFWCRKLCAAAVDEEDVPALLAVKNMGGLESAKTEARKAIRFIDFMNHGPLMEDV